MEGPAARQSVLLLCAAVFLGFSYTFLAQKGFFGKQPEVIAAQGNIPPPSSINLREAKSLYESGDALFIDARHFFDFRRGHIKSATNLPLAEFENRRQTLPSLPRNKTLIVYCDGAECNSSIELAAKLYESGFGGVRIFFGGWQEWTDNRLPTETSQ